MTANLETSASYRNQLDGAVRIDGIAPHFHCMILAEPLSLPLIALAAYVLWTIARCNLTLRILYGFSIMIGFAVVARDSLFYL